MNVKKALNEMNAQEIWDELISNNYDSYDKNSCEAFEARLEYFGNAIRRGDKFSATGNNLLCEFCGGAKVVAQFIKQGDKLIKTGLTECPECKE